MRQQNIHRLFEVSVTLKGLHALLELTIGSATLTLSPIVVANFLMNFAQHGEERGWPEFFIHLLLRVARADLAGGQHFAGVYLLLVGVINLGLVIGLLTGRLWSFPAALTAIAILMAYQMFRYTHTHAPILIALTLFDTVVWLLVRQEYLDLRSRALAQHQASYSNAI
jgi:uncharacterized membrane protein